MNYFLGRILLFILNIKWVDKKITDYLFSRISSMKLSQPENPRLFWGVTPIINFSVYSKSVKDKFVSETVMRNHYFIHKKEDFDLYYEDILERAFKKYPKFLKQKYERFVLLAYAARNYEIFHVSCDGLFFGDTSYYRKEIEVLKQLKKKIVVLPYGSDAYMYSKIFDLSFRHAMLISYPEGARRERIISERFAFFTEIADCIFSGSFLDGVGRWDLLLPMVYCIDTSKWKNKKEYSTADGSNGAVKIIHTPNHRGVKGTEFLLAAIEELKQEGLKVDLLLIENMKNDQVQQIMFNEADILVEQLICVGHGVSAIEGMSTGIPVLSNLSDKHITTVFRRYSYLNECPIVSTNPETLKSNLRVLITNPQLRKEIGEAGRSYVEKYYTKEFMSYVFNNIYDKIWYNKQVDLMNLFHPKRPTSYNNQKPLVKHPLVDNNLILNK
jgi:glycosyltransferase involved in cell wall biosynthesis